MFNFLKLKDYSIPINIIIFFFGFLFSKIIIEIYSGSGNDFEISIYYNELNNSDSNFDDNYPFHLGIIFADQSKLKIYIKEEENSNTVYFIYFSLWETSFISDIHQVLNSVFNTKINEGENSFSDALDDDDINIILLESLLGNNEDSYITIIHNDKNNYSILLKYIFHNKNNESNYIEIINKSIYDINRKYYKNKRKFGKICEYINIVFSLMIVIVCALFKFLINIPKKGQKHKFLKYKKIELSNKILVNNYCFICGQKFISHKNKNLNNGVIQFKCGNIFHERCVIKRLKKYNNDHINY